MSLDLEAEGYLLDTPVASMLWDGLNSRHEAARSRLATLGDAPVFVVVITIGEVAYGLEVSPAIDQSRQASVRAAMAGYERLPIDEHTAEVYGRIRGALFSQYSPRSRRGRLQKKAPEDLIESTSGKALGIQENDLWIVSAAVQYDLILVTSDEGEGMRRVLVAADYLDRAQFWTP